LKVNTRITVAVCFSLLEAFQSTPERFIVCFWRRTIVVVS
jgi:hypothetical protein